MDVIERIRDFGTQQFIADSIGINQSNVGAWLTKNESKRVEIPANRARQLESLTGIPREEIRPDIFGK
ncbi:MAG: putative antitoxin of bacterial toxin-antitoxin system, YdaS/YdaT [Pseudomonadota bacterium]|jgi:DNA-binding transcriptional regulator YdaS (Cro superfamily)